MLTITDLLKKPQKTEKMQMVQQDEKSLGEARQGVKEVLVYRQIWHGMRLPVAGKSMWNRDR
jgi:hypothetical protein